MGSSGSIDGAGRRGLVTMAGRIDGRERGTLRWQGQCRESATARTHDGFSILDHTPTRSNGLGLLKEVFQVRFLA